MKKILFTIPIEESLQQEILSKYNATMIFKNKKEITLNDLQGCTAVIGNINPELLNQVSSIEWLHLESAGADKYAKVLNSTIQLTNSTGAYGPAIAEHMMAGVFYFYKRYNEYCEAQKQHLWNNLGKVDCVGEATVCILGYGDIGQNFAKRMKALGCKIIGVKRTYADAPYADEIVTMNQLEEVLPQSNIIAMCLPSTEETYHFMNEKRLRLCPKDSMLLNVGRGVTLDTDALMRVLDEGYFKGVCLDVTDPEPLPINHPLWRYNNVVITPHVSGNYNMQATFNKVIEMALENLQHYLHKEELINKVNRSTGYKESNQ